MNNKSTGQLSDFVLVGAVDSGKTALMQALLEADGDVIKTQSPVFHGNNVIDTPGEFAAMHHFYGALLCTVSNAATIVYLQPSNCTIFSMPPGLLDVYPDKQVVGVVSQVDLPDADTESACQVLRENHIKEPYFLTSAVSGAGVPELRQHLCMLSASAEA
ncbi:MAG: ethanolamine utilization protein [Proteobacteria bacterium]|nr:MAG: ethanolamine utilization protein [Pseudomonadota bacterium]